MTNKTCSRPNCPLTRKHRGLCHQHYTLWCQQNDQCMLDSSEAVAHIGYLRKLGIGYAQIANLAGLNPRTPEDVVQNRTIRSDTCRKILSVEPPSPIYLGAPDNSWVPSLGTLRRLQALVRLGWTNEILAEGVGVEKNSIARLLLNEPSTVLASTARRTHELFDRLQLTPAPDNYGARRARLRAERRGWAPPLAWDEDAIDDPAAEPIVDKDRVDFAAQITDHRALDRTDDEIAERMGVTLKTLQMRLNRHRIPLGRRYRDVEERQALIHDNPMSRSALKGVA